MAVAPAETEVAQSAAAPSPFTPIADYAFLSDCHTGALVAPDGTIDWLCVPRYDSPSVFGSVLDRQAGGFRLGPYGVTVPATRRYEPGTNVLVTTWNAPSGWIEVREALTIGPRRGPDTVTPHTRPPADEDAAHTARPDSRLPRRCRRGRAACASRSSTTAARPPSGRSTEPPGPPTPAARASPSACAPTWRSGKRAAACAPATSCARASAPTARCRGRRTSHHRPTPSRPTRGWLPTAEFWRAWLDRARPIDHHWREPIERSALTIKGLTYMPTGALIAALTTSLPETPGGERNWDYRYAWMRDSTFTLRALHWLNLDWEADEFMQFVADLEPVDDGGLQIMYGIDGRRDLTESTRDDLWATPGARPVRIGNGAFDQRQNDVYGAVLDSIFLHTRRSQRLPRRLWPIVESQATCATKSGASPTRASGRRAERRGTTSPRS